MKQQAEIYLKLHKDYYNLFEENFEFYQNLKKADPNAYDERLEAVTKNWEALENFSKNFRTDYRAYRESNNCIEILMFKDGSEVKITTPEGDDELGNEKIEVRKFIEFSMAKEYENRKKAIEKSKRLTAQLEYEQALFWKDNKPKLTFGENSDGSVRESLIFPDGSENYKGKAT